MPTPGLHFRSCRPSLHRKWFSGDRLRPRSGTGFAAARGAEALSFSLIELVIVLVIVGIVAAIAVPRFVRASQAAKQAQLESTVAMVRRAIELYYAEHSQYPGFDPETGVPGIDWFTDQMLLRTDDRGAPGRRALPAFIYGPYLKSPFPSNPFNGSSRIKLVLSAGFDGDPVGEGGVNVNGGFGWIYDPVTGHFDAAESSPTGNEDGTSHDSDLADET